ncbi:hypothetical protein ACIRP3_43195 [Streptomyces sp. NPDC101209]|uniref:hypothetical protein n=1 Tax=Streptomyces sp. NPDC101209 TaxID=3366129 RepID=UPI0037FD3D94
MVLDLLWGPSVQPRAHLRLRLEGRLLGDGRAGQFLALLTRGRRALRDRRRHRGTACRSSM